MSDIELDLDEDEFVCKICYKIVCIDSQSGCTTYSGDNCCKNNNTCESCNPRFFLDECGSERFFCGLCIRKQFIEQGFDIVKKD